MISICKQNKSILLQIVTFDQNEDKNVSNITDLMAECHTFATKIRFKEG
jgi:hypothetical protein